MFLDALAGRLGKADARRVFADLRESNDRSPRSPGRSRTEHLRRPAAVLDDAQLHGRAAHGSCVRLERGRSARRPATRSSSPARRSATSIPAFFLEIDLHGGGFDARGVSFPGVPWSSSAAARDYAWSATTSHSDIVDQYVETLCGGDDTHYVYKGQCRAMSRFDAGAQGKGPARPRRAFRTTVHGPVLGYATVGGRRVAISTQRSTRGASSCRAGVPRPQHGPRPLGEGLLRVMNQVEFTLQLVLRGRPQHRHVLERSPAAARPATSTSGCRRTGTGSSSGAASSRSAHAAGVDPPRARSSTGTTGRLADFARRRRHWSYGSVHRVELLRAALPRTTKHTLATPWSPR